MSQVRRKLFNIFVVGESARKAFRHQRNRLPVVEPRKDVCGDTCSSCLTPVLVPYFPLFLRDIWRTPRDRGLHHHCLGEYFPHLGHCRIAKLHDCSLGQTAQCVIRRDGFYNSIQNFYVGRQIELERHSSHFSFAGTAVTPILPKNISQVARRNIHRFPRKLIPVHLSMFSNSIEDLIFADQRHKVLVPRLDHLGIVDP
ncbi:hypothetical protein ES703_122370 [subsurface metagenome]